MRRLIAWTLTLAVGAWAAKTASAQGNQAVPKRPAAPAPAQQPPARVDPNAARARLDADVKARDEMNRILEAWEKQSKSITSLHAAFLRVDKSQAWGEQYYRGQAMLQSPDLACLEFRKFKVDANGKPLVLAGKDGRKVEQLEREPFERIVCTGKEVLQYTWDERKIFVFPLDKQVRQKALQQGPLPFLFNMKAVDAKKRYSMTLLEEKAEEYVIGIVPQEDIDKDSFSKAFLWLNKKTFLPNHLWLFPVANKPDERQEFRFVGTNNTILANREMDKDFFKFTRIDGWKIIENPGAGGPAPPANRGQAAGPAIKRATPPQPAMAPTSRTPR